MTPLTPEQTHAYLHHIGIDDPGPPSLASLDRLIDAHLRRVAFENLDVLLDRPIEIDADKVSPRSSRAAAAVIASNSTRCSPACCWPSATSWNCWWHGYAGGSRRTRR